MNFRSDQGGVMALVAIFVSAGVLFIAIGLAVDSGVVYLERRVVDNSAQAAALAVARECAASPSTCASSPIAQQMADANSPDGKTMVTEICIGGKTPQGSSCLDATSSPIDCNTVPIGVTQYARIRTQTLTSESQSSVDSFFTSRKSTLKGCAQAQWGNATSAPVYSIFALSICEWARQQSGLRVLTEYDTNSGVNDCSYQFTDYAGTTYTKTGINGWGSLDLLSSTLPVGARASVSCPDPSVDQPAQLKIGYQLTQITRDQASVNYCGDSTLANKIGVWLNQTLYIPLVSTQKIQGNSTLHTIEAFAAFRFVGYSLAKGASGGSFPVGNWCPKGTNCIYGEFIRTISPGSEIGSGGPQVGLQAIELF